MGLTFSFFSLIKINREAFANKGYSPLLNFHVNDLVKTIELIKNYGGNLDGEIIQDEDFKVLIISFIILICFSRSLV